MAVETGTSQLVMPEMGDSVSEGTILEWHKQEGDPVAVDETVVEISTDKVDAEVPSLVAGTVVKIYAAEGDTVAVGAPLAEIALGDGAAAASSGSSGNGGAAQTSSDNGGGNGASDDGAGGGETVDIITPAGGDSVTEGTILEWSVKVGDPIKEGDTVVEISTDKVDMELPSPATGTISEVLFNEGDTVTVGAVIARLVTGAGAVAPTSAPSNGSSASAKSNGAASSNGAAAGATGVTPIAQRAAAGLGVNLGDVKGSARGGRITKDDVLSAHANGAAELAALPEAAQQIKGAGAALARYMDESRSIPTATSFRTLTITTMDARRKQLKGAGQKVSFTHLIAYAIAKAATDQMPVMAHHFTSAAGKPYRVDDGQVNLGIAVDVEKKDGTRTLMVPVIRNAGGVSFKEFIDAFNVLIDKARTNSLAADDLAGANISLTNPGGIGTIASVPRLMVGQGTIVATGSIAYPIGLEAVGELIGAEKVMSMTSTYDHRIIQGAESGRFLKVIEEYLQGEHGFYEGVFSGLGASMPALPPKPSPQLASTGAPASAAAAAPPASTGAEPGEEMLQAVQAATSLLKAHRTNGHLAAKLDPLGQMSVGDPSLDPAPLGLTPELMARIPSRILRMYVPGETLADSLPYLHDVYCGSMAYEIEHIASHRQRLWLREAIESGTYRTPLTADEKRALLARLTSVDSFERFMRRTYLGQKSFSIEGLDMTVPMIDEIIQLAAGNGAREVVLGMAHRGRVNVLAHTLGRPYGSLFAEFEGSHTLAAITTIPDGGTGDVKYHHGAEGAYQLPGGESILVRLESNPSHLEFVSPVVDGATRAAQTSRQGAHASQDTNAAVPIILHGDAAFPGQGVVAETFNLQALDGYNVGGSVHIIQNNQIGFTTDPEDDRSTTYASDMAKGFDVPIIHVNADDVEACISAVRLAVAFRQEFGHDVLIDLVGYRRLGHNEQDEPAYTQPEMYAAIKQHPTVREILSEEMIKQGVITEADSVKLADAVWADMSAQHSAVKERIAHAEEAGDEATGEYKIDETAPTEVATAVPEEKLQTLTEELLAVPDGFTIHPKLVKQLTDRRTAFGEEHGPMNWAFGEALAFSSLLTEGIPIRLTGQDTERGTFSNRHLVLHDPKTGQEHCAIQHLPDARATMELHNSALSETACLGFEYGYAQEAPETLVLWEAQFGDFANGAQVIIDQFITSGMAKWGQTSRLTLLLPHGYEGAGPEHSSARLERFLQMAAEGNIRVANCTTPAQYFHLLRRQARIAEARPLIVMTPKQLLRLPAAASHIEDFTSGGFNPVMAEPGVDPEAVTRLLLCSGKVYYDIVGHETRAAAMSVAVGRVELLYPFPEQQLLELMDSYPNLTEVIWVQEEPRNMGARAHMSARLRQILPREMMFGYVGRPERAASGEGYPVAHSREQNRIASTALDVEQKISQFPYRNPGNR
jgi:multifunctional 2-oxoglutarate metabolism enzyme